MNNILVIVVKSSFENIDNFRDRIYFEAERDGYYNVTKETKTGVFESVFIFNNLRNEEFVKTIISGYEYLNDSDIYFGDIKHIEEYVAKEYSGKPTRIKITLPNEEFFDIAQDAKDFLKIEINSSS